MPTKLSLELIPQNF